MILLVPSGSTLSTPGRGFPLVTVLVALLALSISGLQWWYLSLPMWAQELASATVPGRLYADPGQHLFHIIQAWSGPLYHQGWAHVLPLLVLWLSFGIVLERQWGSLRSLAIYVAIAPIAASAQLMQGGSEPVIGLSALVLALAGALYARRPDLRLRWSCWYLFPWAVGWRRLHSGIVLPLGLWLAWEIPRMAWSGAGEGATAVMLAVVVLFLSGIASYLLVATVAGHPARQTIRGLQGIASGERPLDGLEQALHSEDTIPLQVLEPIAARCIREQRPDVARILATYFALRAPEHPCYGRLREFLHPPQDESE